MFSPMVLKKIIEMILIDVTLTSPLIIIRGVSNNKNKRK